MAYISQYEIDKRQDAEANSIYKGLGQAAGSYFLNQNENRARALAEKNKRDAEDIAFAKDGIDAATIQAARDSGNMGGIQMLYSQIGNETREANKEILKAKRAKEVYDAEQLAKPIEERDDTRKAVIVGQEREKIYANRMGNQEQNRIEGEQRAIENDKTKSLNKAAIPGYEVADPNIIPTAKDAEEVKNASIFTKNFSDSGNSAIKRVETLDWKDRTGLTGKWTELQQDVTDMQMAAKEMYKLGVLNGPDLSLVNQGLGSLSVIELNRLGPQAAMERVRNTIASAQSKLQNAVNARGYKPKAPATPDLSKMSREEKIRMLNGN